MALGPPPSEIGAEEGAGRIHSRTGRVCPYEKGNTASQQATAAGRHPLGRYLIRMVTQGVRRTDRNVASVPRPIKRRMELASNSRSRCAAERPRARVAQAGDDGQAARTKDQAARLNAPG